MAKEFQYGLNAALVETDKGTIRGYRYDGLTIFKGIPYAQAKRFHAPEEVKEWKGIFDATNYGYVCPLLEDEKPKVEMSVPHRYWPMHEDCQNLNVWTPQCDDQKRPVMVWLHGGGYSAGSAIEQVAYEGENMSREGNVVVVSVNHRLNILGYLDLSSYGKEYENSGNAGMDDIIMALKWVQKNIAAFGGDPENVTLFGQSGGGAKITTLLQMPAADGLFAKGINMSGVVGGLMRDPEGDAKELIEAMMKELKIKTVKEMETVPYYFLAEAYNKLRPEFAKAGKYTGGAPHVNKYYVGDPADVGFRKETKDVPLLVGSVFGEFTSFGPFPYDKHSMTEAEQLEKVEAAVGKEGMDELLPLFREAYPERPVIDLLALDFMFRAAGLTYIRDRSAMNTCTYSYMFNQDMPMEGGRTPWHCCDIPFVFHNADLVPNTQMGDLTEKLQDEIFGCVMAFAKTGNPNHPGIPEWKPSEADKEYVLVVDENTRILTNYDRELVPAAEKWLKAAMVKKMQEEKDQIQH